MVHKAQSLSGTCTGEHGIGRGKRPYLSAELGPGTVALLRSIKELLDPGWVFNPGCLLFTPEEQEAQRVVQEDRGTANRREM